jgi:AraC-like DNA-binding protein
MIEMPNNLPDPPKSRRAKMDVVQDLLSSMRLAGGVFLEADFTAPWCVTASIDAADCAPVLVNPAHVIGYHYVREGRLVCYIPGEPPIEAGAGEILLFPRSGEHLLGDELTATPIRAGQLVRPALKEGLARIEWGGGGAKTSIFCGFLGSVTPPNMLLLELPAVLKVNILEGPRRDWLVSSLRYAADEMASNSPLVLGKLTEALLLEAVRRYMQTLPPEDGGSLAGLADPPIGRALSLIHRRYAEDLTTEQLARVAGMSRSAFAERFLALTGEPPMRYCARWRMRVAANLLSEGRTNAASVAYEVGFNSEAAFSRAFKREFDLPPAQWRRRHAFS